MLKSMLGQGFNHFDMFFFVVNVPLVEKHRVQKQYNNTIFFRFAS